MTTKTHFVITGLPRSRTAWLSVLLSRGDCFCVHELSGTDPTLEWFNDNDYRVSGTADSGIFLCAEHIPKDAVIIQINRNREDVIASLVYAFPELSDERIGILLDLQTPLDVDMEVDFEDLSNYEVCNQIWTVIGNRFPLERDWFDLVNRMNIQVQDVMVPVSNEYIERLRSVTCQH